MDTIRSLNIRTFLLFQLLFATILSISCSEESSNHARVHNLTIELEKFNDSLTYTEEIQSWTEDIKYVGFDGSEKHNFLIEERLSKIVKYPCSEMPYKGLKYTKTWT